VTYPGPFYMDSFSKSFLKFAAIVFLFTGAAKIVSGLGPDKVLLLDDPLTGIPIRWLMAGVGSIEVAFAVILMRARRGPVFKLSLIAWLSSVFLGYRIGLHLINWSKPCSCLGSITGILHISPNIADLIMKAVLVVLLLGSYGLLACHFVLTRRGDSSRPSSAVT
jgi:hypothetical protein